VVVTGRPAGGRGVGPAASGTSTAAPPPGSRRTGGVALGIGVAVGHSGRAASAGPWSPPSGRRRPGPTRRRRAWASAGSIRASSCPAVTRSPRPHRQLGHRAGRAEAEPAGLRRLDGPGRRHGHRHRSALDRRRRGRHRYGPVTPVRQHHHGRDQGGREHDRSGGPLARPQSHGGGVWSSLLRAPRHYLGVASDPAIRPEPGSSALKPLSQRLEPGSSGYAPGPKTPSERRGRPDGPSSPGDLHEPRRGPPAAALRNRSTVEGDVRHTVSRRRLGVGLAISLVPVALFAAGLRFHRPQPGCDRPGARNPSLRGTASGATASTFPPAPAVAAPARPTLFSARPSFSPNPSFSRARTGPPGPARGGVPVAGSGRVLRHQPPAGCGRQHVGQGHPGVRRTPAHRHGDAGQLRGAGLPQLPGRARRDRDRQPRPAQHGRPRGRRCPPDLCAAAADGAGSSPSG
jgi:hypothetical protein